MSTSQTNREALLEEAALSAARAWTAAYRVEFAREGRPVEGGWPGTLPEARMRADAAVGKALSERSMQSLTHEERGKIARITYDEARRSWRATLTVGRP